MLTLAERRVTALALALARGEHKLAQLQASLETKAAMRAETGQHS